MLSCVGFSVELVVCLNGVFTADFVSLLLSTTFEADELTKAMKTFVYEKVIMYIVNLNVSINRNLIISNKQS